MCAKIEIKYSKLQIQQVTQIYFWRQSTLFTSCKRSW